MGGKIYLKMRLAPRTRWLLKFLACDGADSERVCQKRNLMEEKKRNRRAYSANERRNLLDQFRASEESAREFCRLHSLSERTLRYWRQMARKRQSESGNSIVGTDSPGGKPEPANPERLEPTPAAPVAFSWSLSTR